MAETGSATATISGCSGMVGRVKGVALTVSETGCAGCLGAGKAGSGSGCGSGAEIGCTAAAMVSAMPGTVTSGTSFLTEAKPAVTRSINARAFTNSSGLKSTMTKPRDPNLPDAFLWFHLTHCLQRYVTESV